MLKHRVIFFNGPPSCGKDTIVKHMAAHVPFYHLKFAAPLKAQLCALLECTPEWLEENKDKPHPVLGGGTPRQYLIHLSETMIKPNYGVQFFGNVAAAKMIKIAVPYYIFFSDSGFREEAIPVIKTVGIESCMKVEIHRPNFDFKADSRSYWSLPGLKNVLIANSTNLEQLYRTAEDVIKEWMSGFPPLPPTH